MQLVNNTLEVTLKSYASQIGIVLGAVLTFYAYVNTSSAHIQEVMHFSAWSEWVPWFLGLATAFGVPIGRSIKQPKVEAAANK